MDRSYRYPHLLGVHLDASLHLLAIRAQIRLSILERFPLETVLYFLNVDRHFDCESGLIVNVDGILIVVLV